jgi:hypothetical protein
MRVNLKDIEEMILKIAKGSLSEVVVLVCVFGKEGFESLISYVVFGLDISVDLEVFLRGLVSDLLLL